MNRAEMDAEYEQMHRKLLPRWASYVHGFEEFTKPFFTGLKGDGWLQSLSLEANEGRLAGLTTQSFVGQWLLYASSDGPFLYVNVPVDKCGRYAKGDCFDIGEKRFTTATTREEIDEAMQAGLDALLALAADGGLTVVQR